MFFFRYMYVPIYAWEYIIIKKISPLYYYQHCPQLIALRLHFGIEEIAPTINGERKKKLKSSHPLFGGDTC